MERELCEVKIPNGVVGDIHSFRNYDPLRIKRYAIQQEQLCLVMTEKDRRQALEEFKQISYTFYDAVQAQQLPEVMAYSNVIFEDELTVFTFYMKKANYKADLLTAIIEPTLLIDAFYYQLYRGITTPQITIRYAAADGSSVYDVQTHYHI
ncbi:hypothetical protein CH76_07365 [Lysinibacillus sp. BF-4]|uniref:hypothetical protein n=1 Tax=Lysinibacillus sp. BF-4 TaxID=1473546 RepID=UPI0005018DBF|nr:hypothetical protein [Lysinibacillus sp. BF-4]KFL43358.1 hypothetical protein CH76_07365 [Lysinibacillus sp. BF-4]